MGKDGTGGEEAPAKAEQNSFQAMLVETRKRMARINSYLDMIPAQFVLGYDHALIQEAQKNLDPAKAKRTSAMLVEAALMDVKKDEGDQNAGSGAAGSSRTGKKRKLKQASSAAASSQDWGEDQPNSREELHEKLQRRLAELKEERRKRQSEVDKAKAKAVREAREAESKAQEKVQKVADVARERSWKQRALGPDAEEEAEDSLEVGRLVFDPKKASLPFDAEVNRRGSKSRRLRNELRRQEVAGEKLREAEERGEGDDLRRDMGMQKALLRAQGQKVHDDINKLRKAQKAMDMRKKKGRDKREEQKEDVKRQQDEKHERRKENLAKRAGGKKKHRRSGFEGKRDGYLNSES